LYSGGIALEVRRLSYFMRISEHGSLTKASNVLRIAQPALSRQMRLLEEELGVPLFNRTSRGMRLTEEGEALRASVAGPLRELELALQNIKSFPFAAEANIAIGLPVSLADILATPLARRIDQEFPNIKLCIVEGMTGSLIDWLSRGVVDFVLLEEEAHHDQLQEQKLVTLPVILTGPADSHLPPGQAVAFSDAVKLPLVLPSHHLGLRAVINDAAMWAQAKLNIRMEADSSRLTKDLLTGGLADHRPGTDSGYCHRLAQKQPNNRPARPGAGRLNLADRTGILDGLKLPAIRRCFIERERTLIGQIMLILHALNIPLITENRRLEDGGITGKQQVNRRAPQCDLPNTITALQPVDIAAADDASRHPIVIQQRHHHIALRMRRITVDRAEMGGNIMRVQLRPRGMRCIGPGGIFRSWVYGIAMLVHAILMICAGKDIHIMPVMAAGMQSNAIVNRLAVLEVLNIAAQLFEFFVVHRNPPDLSDDIRILHARLDLMSIAIG
jgi:LysR family transcriptional regulator, nitrogen assimilation regulatory protein